jgi:cytokinin dehydrogenase
METNRRTLLIAGLAATVPAASLVAAAPKNVATTHDTNWPAPALDGELRFDETAQAAGADDFGHIIHKMPQGVLVPGPDTDVAETIRWVAERGGKFAPRGQGHSVFGRAMAHDGIVGDMSRLRTVHGVESDRIVVDAGAK